MVNYLWDWLIHIDKVYNGKPRNNYVYSLIEPGYMAQTGVHREQLKQMHQCNLR